MGLGDPRDEPTFDHNTWIDYFKDPVTRIRICPSECWRERENGEMVYVYGVEAWPGEREHFHPKLKGIPCVKNWDRCGPCEDEDPEISKTRKFWYFNAIDDKGECRVYKTGVTMRGTLLGREARMRAEENEGPEAQPLTRLDHKIVREGAGYGTTYMPETGKIYDVDFSTVELRDIKAILVALGERTKELYFPDDAGGQYDPEPEAEPKHGVIPEPEIDPSAPIVPKAKTVPAQAATPPPPPPPAPKKKAAPAKPPPRPVADVPAPALGGWGSAPTLEQLEEASADEIRSWLTAQNVEFPPRAPRARLIELATEAAAPPF